MVGKILKFPKFFRKRSSQVQILDFGTRKKIFEQGIDFVWHFESVHMAKSVFQNFKIFSSKILKIQVLYVTQNAVHRTPPRPFNPQSREISHLKATVFPYYMTFWIFHVWYRVRAKLRFSSPWKFTVINLGSNPDMMHLKW